MPWCFGTWSKRTPQEIPLCAWMQRRKWNIYFTCVQWKYSQVNTNCVIVQVLCCVAPIVSTGCCEGSWASHIWRDSIWSSSTAVHSSFHTMTGFNIVVEMGQNFACAVWWQLPSFYYYNLQRHLWRWAILQLQQCPRKDTCKGDERWPYIKENGMTPGGSMASA